jgi:hypothetical protein
MLRLAMPVLVIICAFDRTTIGGRKMTRLARIAVLASALAAAAPASAQSAFTSPNPPPGSQPFQSVTPIPTWDNVLRVNVGVSFYNSTWYSCYSWGWTVACSTNAWASFIPFTVGPQLDLNLEGVNNISIGFNVLLGTAVGTALNGQSISGSVTVWEPTLDYVAKFGPSTQDTVGRFRVGGGMYIGPNASYGGAFRVGGGASFLNANRVGIGLDLVLEAGSYHGYWIDGLQLVASPEFHF